MNLLSTPSSKDVPTRAEVSRALFVTGTSRSGTELMRQVLNAHPSISICTETHFFSDLRARLDAPELLQPTPSTIEKAERYFELLRRGSYGLEGAERSAATVPKLDLQVTDRTLSSRGIDRIFQHHCLSYAVSSGKQLKRLKYWGEKTPRHIFNTPEILTAFPEAKIIFTLRDPRSVCASYRNWRNYWVDKSTASQELQRALTAEERRKKITGSTTGLSLLWRAAVNTAEHAIKVNGSDRVHIVKFEDLLQAPAFEIRRLCAFLGLEPNPDMRLVKRTNSSFVPNGKVQGFDSEAAISWSKHLSKREVAGVEILCNDPMKRNGYLSSMSGYDKLLGMFEIIDSGRSLPRVLWENRKRIGRPIELVRRLASSIKLFRGGF